MNSTEPFLVWGQSEPPFPLLALRAGPLSALYDSRTGFLRRIRLGGREVLRGIYAAVRDRDWRTVPAEIQETRRELADREFLIEFEAHHQLDDIDFLWRGRLEGRSDGSLRYDFDGEARSGFLRNRIGFCVLHPIRECAGIAVHARHGDGRKSVLAFPERIAPSQPIPGFENLASLTHEVQSGTWAEVAFEGDDFETEDQRNWTDASYKTYCTPYQLPFPVEVPPGSTVRQSVALRLVEDHTRRTNPEIVATPATSSNPTSSRRRTRRSPSALEPELESMNPDASEPIILERTNPTDFVRLPEIGLGWANLPLPLTPLEFDRLAALQLAHLRVEIETVSPGWTALLERAARDASELGLSLELVLNIESPDTRVLDPLRAELTRLRIDLSRMVVLGADRLSTPPDLLSLARRDFSDLGVPIGGGTGADLYELYRVPPPREADFIAWSMNPQVHASDALSILETPGMALDQVRSVQHYLPGRPLVVSPLSLRPRFNAVATGPQPHVASDALPPDADPRQMSLVGAAWTAAILGALMPSGIESLTIFQTAGPLGLMASPPGGPVPQEFPAETGTVYPLYHVMRALAGVRRCAALTREPLEGVGGVRLDLGGGMERVVLANLTPAPRSVSFRGEGPGTVRQFDPATVRNAMRDPERFWREPTSSTSLQFDLGPFGITFLDHASRDLPAPASS